MSSAVPEGVFRRGCARIAGRGQAPGAQSHAKVGSIRMALPVPVHEFLKESALHPHWNYMERSRNPE